MLLDPKPFVGGDNAGYMALAESLRTGQGYRDIYLPDAPLHAQYPPVYPTLLAVTGALGGGLMAFKVLSLVFTSAATVFLFLLGRTRLGAEGGMAIAAAFGLNPVLLYYSHWVLSEAPFVLLTLVALWSAQRADGSARFLALAVGAAALAYLTRSAGLPLLLALLLALTWRRSWRRLAAAGGATALVISAWWLWGNVVASDSAQTYSSNFLLVNPYDPQQGYAGAGELLARLVDNVRLYAVEVLPQSLGGAAAPGGLDLIALLVGLAIIALALVAWIRRIREGRTLEWFVLLYAGLICLWPQVWTDRRFLLPLLPILLLLAMDGLLWCLDFARARPRSWLLPAVGGLLLLLTVPSHVRNVRFNQECLRFYRMGDELACYPPPWRAFVESAYWVRDNTEAAAIVVNRKPRLFYYFSRRRGDVYPFSSDDAAMLAFLDQLETDYVIVAGISGTTYRYLVPVIRSVPQRFELLYSIGEGAAAAHILRYRGEVPAGGPDG